MKDYIRNYFNIPYKIKMNKYKTTFRKVKLEKVISP